MMASRATWGSNFLACLFRRTHQPLQHINSAVCQSNFSVNQPKCWYSCISSHHNGGLFFCNRNVRGQIEYQPIRYYAKSRDKKKSDKGHKKKVEINEELVAEVINIGGLHEQMQASVEKLKDDIIKNLSLRSTSGSIETLPITFEGKDYVLQELAQIVRKNPKTVVINMSDFPQVIPTVLQAIRASGMNLNPQQDGTTLFIPIPKVTKEHRETLSKNAKALFIKCRDSIKDVQNKFIKTVKNKEKNGLAQDTSHLICDYITYLATEYISEAEKMTETKQQELLKES